MARARAGQAIAYLLALALAAVLVTWVASGDPLDSLSIRDQLERVNRRKAGGEQPPAVGPARSLLAAAERVGAAIWQVTSMLLLVAAIAVLAVGSARTAARHRRRYRRYLIEPYRSDEASPEDVEDLFESWHQQLVRRWWLRLLLGQDSLALELASERSGEGGGRARLFVVCPQRVARAVEGALLACYPNSRLVAGEAGPQRPRRVIRLKKRYEFIRRLRTPRDYGSPLVDAALAQMEAVEGPTVLQHVLTPTPAAFDRLARSMFREQEAKLERARLREYGHPGLRSELAEQELEGGMAIQHRTLFFGEVRVGGERYADADAVAAIVQGESSAENRLVKRHMRPWARGPLYARRMQAALGNPTPSWRHGILSSRELAGLWQLPSPGLKGVRLDRSSVPRALAPPQLSRDLAHALLRDERGPVGILPGDKDQGLALIGGQGTGKTSLMTRSVAVDARDRDCAQILLDPKSDGADKWLSAIPGERRVHYLDLERPEIGVNPLLAPGDPATVADKFVEAMRDIHEEGDIRASSDRYLRLASLAAVAAHRLGALEEPPSLWDVYRLLLPDETEFREHVVRAIEAKPSYTAAAAFLGRDLPGDLKASPTMTAQKLDAPRNKILRLLVESLDKVLRHPNQLSLDELIRAREILVVDGRMGTFGPDNCRVMMQFICNLAYGAMQRQQQLPEPERSRVALKIDEAHLILNESFANALATLRTAGLEVVAAWQYGEQVQDPKIRGGLMSLLRHRCVFSVGDVSDAREMTELAMPVYTDVIRDDREARQNLAFTPDTLFNLPNHRAVASWISGGQRTAGFVGETFAMELDRTAIEHHLAQQRARGGFVPEDLPSPFGATEPLYRVPATGVPTRVADAGNGKVPDSQEGSGRRGDEPEQRAEGANAPRAPSNDDFGRQVDVRKTAATSNGGAVTPLEPRQVDRAVPRSDSVDDAPLGTISGAEVPESYKELDLDEATRLHWDKDSNRAPDRAPEPTREQLEALRALYELRFASASQLARLCWPDAAVRTYRRHLETMFKAGWVRRFQIATRAGGQRQRIYMLTKRGFELAQARRGPRGPYVDPGLSWREPEVGDARRVIHDLHATAWLIAFRALAWRLVRDWRGPRNGRVRPPARRDRGEWVTLTAQELPLGGSRRIRDLRLSEFKPVEPDLTLELSLPTSPPQRFDVLVEVDRTGRASRNLDKFARYDALLTAWGRHTDRYKMQGEIPVVVFVVEDEPTALSFVQAADEVITGAVVAAGTPPEEWEYPGRERVFFVCERDVHMGTLRSYRLPRYPIEVRKARSGDGRRSKNRPQPEQLPLLERRLLGHPRTRAPKIR